MTRVFYPGTFDPLHNGHLEIISVAAELFATVVVAAMRNPSKAEPFFDQATRVELIRESTSHLANVEAVSMNGLVVEAAADAGANMIVKGLRGVTDFENELQMAQMNRHVSGIVSVFIPSTSEDSYIASKYIREITLLGGDVTDLVPDPVAKAMRERLE